jgi:HK97 family phage prohead protease
MEFETRSGTPIEIRAADDGSIVVEGYAALYDVPADIAGMFREVIKPGAFRSALARKDDVTLNINHNDNFLLARTSSGTLQLSEDAKGLKVRSELDALDPDVVRLVRKMKRGDLSEMSFAFSIPEGGQDWTRASDGLDVREIRDVMLHDVSVVATPAYTGTSIALRSRDEANKEQNEDEAKRTAWAARQAQRKAEAEQKFRRL